MSYFISDTRHAMTIDELAGHFEGLAEVLREYDAIRSVLGPVTHEWCGETPPQAVRRLVELQKSLECKTCGGRGREFMIAGVCSNCDGTGLHPGVSLIAKAANK